MTTTAEIWRCENLRLTTFHATAIAPKSVDWWDSISGVEAEMSQIQPNSRQDNAEFGRGRLTNAVNLNRVDWVYSAGVPLGGEDGGLGPMGDALDQFLPLANRWLERSKDLLRLAFGAIAFIPVANKEQGYRQLQTSLHALRLDPIGSSDLVYRINRPRQMIVGAESILFNRVSSWALRRIELSGEVVGSAAIPVMRIERATCELDLSTAADRVNQLSEGEAKAVLERLVQSGMEILAEGDVP